MTIIRTRAGAILIARAGSGIGKVAAERFGREGWTIVLASRNPKHLDPIVLELVGNGINAHAIVVEAAMNAVAARPWSGSIRPKGRIKLVSALT